MEILLGDAVVSVMQGMESQEEWPVAAALSAFLGMSVLFLIWWWYFDGAAGAAEQPVRSRRDAVRFHVWSYVHLPLYLGLAVTGVGVNRIVTVAARGQLAPEEVAIATGAMALTMIAMTAIGATSAGRRGRAGYAWWVHVAPIAATLMLGLVPGISSPPVLIVAFTALCVTHLALSLRGAHPQTNTAEHPWPISAH